MSKALAIVVLLLSIGCRSTIVTSEVSIWPKTVLDPDKDKSAEELKWVISQLLPEPRPVLDSVELIAWCSKEFAGAFRPRVGEEILVLAKTAAAQWVLAYLCSGYVRDVTVVLPGAAWAPGLHLKHHAQRFPLKWYSLYDHEPGEQDIIQFTLSTNFGNNEFRDYVRVLGVVLFDGNQRQVREALERGLGSDEVRARRAAYMTSIEFVPSPDWKLLEKKSAQ